MSKYKTLPVSESGGFFYWQKQSPANTLIGHFRTDLAQINALINILAGAKAYSNFGRILTPVLMKQLYRSFAFRLLSISLFILFANTLSAQMITTIAGGSIGDGKPATSIGMTVFWSLLGEQVLAIDNAENLYIIDNNTRRVRKISSSTGIITTIAGNGNTTLPIEGKLATEIGYGYMHSIFVDKSGNIYLGSTGRISKIDAVTGISRTIAGNGKAGYSGDGGLATAAKLSLPRSITIDTAGNIYFTDQGSTIRKITAATGIISTIAGTGTQGYSGDGGPATQAQLSAPVSITCDEAGNIYFHDNNNRRIRKITAATGIISTYVGTGGYGVTGDGGPAVDATIAYPVQITADKEGNLYFGDLSRIRKVNAATGIINIIAGKAYGGYTPDGANATDAVFANIGELVLGPGGNIYFREPNTALFRKIDANTNILSTVGGNGTIGLSNIGGPATDAQLFQSNIAIDRDNNMYIADYFNHYIHWIDPYTKKIHTLGGTGKEGYYLGDGQLMSKTAISPGAIAVDSTGNIYFTENGQVIRKASITTGVLSTIAGMQSRGYSGDGGPATAAQFNTATDIQFDKAGNLYIADIYNNVIRKISAATGIITTIAGNGTAGYSGDGGVATAANLNNPQKIAIDRFGNLFISEANNNTVRRVDAATSIITTIAGTGAAGYNGDSIPGTAAMLRNPTGLAIDTAGNIYIADQLNSRVRKITAKTGKISTIAGLDYSGYNGDSIPASTAALYQPTNLRIDTAGNLIVTDNTYRIRKIDIRSVPPVTTPDPNPNPVPDSTDSIPPVVVSKVYPNPAMQGSITIALKGPISGKVSATVTDIYGKTITLEQVVLQPTTDYKLTITLPPLKQGLYYVKVLINNERQTHTLMIQ